MTARIWRMIVTVWLAASVVTLAIDVAYLWSGAR